MRDLDVPPTLAVFAGAGPGRDPGRSALARRLGAQIAAAGARLVYGGGAGGLMAAAADGARDGGGAVIGVYPTCLIGRETVDPAIELIEVAALADRKAAMAQLADAFVVLPGGLGTLEEAVEMLSLARLGLLGRDKPIVFLDDDGYWDPFFALIAHMISEEFAPARLMGLAQRAQRPDDAVAACRAACAARLEPA